MASISTKAIILNSIKYSDSSLIVKCYTKEEGLKSYLVRGVLKSKKGKIKAAYFQPLTQLQIEAVHKPNNNLHNFKEVQVINTYSTIYKDIVKQTIVMFLSEVLSKTIKEEEPNSKLYEYIESAINWLDVNDKTSNFHLLFLLNLTYFLGFYPDLTDKNKSGFNLLEGSFTDNLTNKFTISSKKLTLLKKLLGINFDAIERVSFNKEERQTILQVIIQYFELHLDGFKRPKSLDVLKVVFD